MLRVRWRELETGSRTSLLGHERGNPGHRQGLVLIDYRACSRPYQVFIMNTHGRRLSDFSDKFLEGTPLFSYIIFSSVAIIPGYGCAAH